MSQTARIWVRTNNFAEKDVGFNPGRPEYSKQAEYEGSYRINASRAEHRTIW